MKFGLIAGLSLLSHLAVCEFFVFSVFILGIDVGQMTNDSSSNEITYTEGKVCFRIIMFKDLYQTYNEMPKVSDLIWYIYYMTDFELSFSQLKKDFKKKLFDDLSFKFSFNTKDIKVENPYEQVIKDSSFKIKLNDLEIKAEGTHVISYLTKNFSMEANKFTIDCQSDCEIKFIYSEHKMPEDSKLSFVISNNFQFKNNCEKPINKLLFKMNSIKLNDTNRGASNKWKDVKYKVQSIFQIGEEVLHELTPFKMKTSNRLAIVIFVINYIPIILFDASDHFLSKSNYEFPYAVQLRFPINDPNSNLDPFDDAKKSWPALTQTYIKGTNIFESSISSDNLISKWQEDKQLISMTLNFKCLNKII